jgi:hypothetical protein
VLGAAEGYQRAGHALAHGRAGDRLGGADRQREGVTPLAREVLVDQPGPGVSGARLLSAGAPNCIHKTIKQPRTAIHPASVSRLCRWQARAIRPRSPGVVGPAAWRQMLPAGVSS